MSAKKCTHPRGYPGGACPICRARKRGPKPKRAPATFTATPPRPAPAAPPTPAAAPIDPNDRAARMARLLPPTPPLAEPPPEAAPEIEDPQPEDPEIEPASKSTLGYGWDWTARKFVTALDMGTSLAIDAFTDREPLDAGDDETAELERITAEYGEKRVGQIEAPTWVVFLIAIAFFTISKYAGAPKKPKALTAKIEPSTPGTRAPASVDSAATKIPAAATAAATTETPRPNPAPLPAAGPAVDAGCGY